MNVVQAHKSPISHLAINSTGTLLATASDKGTVIRVFAIPSAEKLYQFRRGTREAKIHSVSFNTVSSLLAVSSATDTVHIFRLVGPKGDSKRGAPPGSPAGSVDSQDGRGQGGLEGGYEAFIDGKKKNGNVAYVKVMYTRMALLIILPVVKLFDEDRWDSQEISLEV